MKPTICRAVHVTHEGQGPFAAIVTGVNDDATVDLFVMPPRQSAYALHGVPSAESEPQAEACWSWPPQQPADPTPTPAGPA